MDASGYFTNSLPRRQLVHDQYLPARSIRHRNAPALNRRSSTHSIFFFPSRNVDIGSVRYKSVPLYNSTYPLSPTVISASLETTYRIAIISDLDTSSKTESNLWISYLRPGRLTVSKDFRSVSVNWDKEVVLKSDISQKGRGMELSELVAFNGKLYTCDDRSGIVFEITPDWKILPFVVLNDGDGKQTKG